VQGAREDGGLTRMQVAKIVGRAQTWVSKSELGEGRVDVVDWKTSPLPTGSPWSGSARGREALEVG